MNRKERLQIMERLQKEKLELDHHSGSDTPNPVYCAHKLGWVEALEWIWSLGE